MEHLVITPSKKILNNILILVKTFRNFLKMTVNMTVYATHFAHRCSDGC